MNNLLSSKTNAWLILIISLFATGLLWYNIKSDLTEAHQIQFEQRVERIKTAIINRMQTYQQVLQSGVGLFNAVTEVSRDAWHRYAISLQLDEQYPGLPEFGFSLNLHPEELLAHIAKMRTEGFPDYTVHPNGKRDEYTAIIVMEPMSDSNLPAFGYDMFSQPDRRIAMGRARDTDQPAMSSKIVLVQDVAHGKIQSGFLMYLPVYRYGQPNNTIAERRDALLGYVYGAFRVNELMRGIFGQHPLDIDYEIYDGDGLITENLMYDNDDIEHLLDEESSPFVKTLPLDIAGHRWTLQFTSLPSFVNAIRNDTPEIVLVAGILLSVLLFLMVRGNARLLNSQGRLHESIRQLNYLKDTLKQQVADRTETLRQEIQERKQAQSVALENEDRFKAIFNNPVIGILVIDEVGRFLEGNIKLLEMFGYSREEFTHLTNLDITHPDDIAISHERMQRLVAGLIDSYHLEKRYVRKDGSVFWGDLYATPRRDCEGQFIDLTAIILDITKRKRAEEALRQSEEQFDLAMQGSNDGLWDWNLKTNEVYFSPRWKSMLGFAEDEIRHHVDEFKRLTHPDDLVAVCEKLAAYLEKRTLNYEATLRMQHKDGHWVWILARGMALWHEHSKPYRMVGTHTDLTALKQAEESLRRSEERFNLAMQGANDGLWDWDVKTNQIYYSPRLKQIFGLTEEKAPGVEAFSRVLHPDDVEYVWKTIYAYLEKKIPSYETTFRIPQKNGHDNWVLSRAIAVWNAQ
ncbi:MAG: hypothetical protein BWK79_06590, partial [Beggiatoa sp. IS2]